MIEMFASFFSSKSRPLPPNECATLAKQRLSSLLSSSSANAAEFADRTKDIIVAQAEYIKALEKLVYQLQASKSRDYWHIPPEPLASASPTPATDSIALSPEPLPEPRAEPPASASPPLVPDPFAFSPEAEPPASASLSPAPDLINLLPPPPGSASPPPAPTPIALPVSILSDSGAWLQSSADSLLRLVQDSLNSSSPGQQYEVTRAEPSAASSTLTIVVFRCSERLRVPDVLHHIDTSGASGGQGLASSQTMLPSHVALVFLHPAGYPTTHGGRILARDKAPDSFQPLQARVGAGIFDLVVQTDSGEAFPPERSVQNREQLEGLARAVLPS